MSIKSEQDLQGMQIVCEAVGTTLKKMREHATPGMSTKDLDEYGYSILKSYGANSAPKKEYGFPGWNCISINHEIAHGIPSKHKILKEGDLVNIDVSAELNGYYGDNGGSFILGQDKNQLSSLVEASKEILYAAISKIRGGIKIASIGEFIETQAKNRGFQVIRNLTGHGIGLKLHEDPQEIPCFYDRNNKGRFQKNTVIALETFIPTKAKYASESSDGWTLKTLDGSYVAQHEHTLMITDNYPIIFTKSNDI